MRKAEKFLSGETLKYDIGPKLNLLVERSNREIKGDGRTIMVNEFGNVISISRIGGNGGGAGGGSGSLSIICITGKTDDTTYTADLYGNGKDSEATESDITVKVLDIAEGETIPNDTWFFANQQTWGTGEAQETYYTIDIARWL